MKSMVYLTFCLGLVLSVMGCTIAPTPSGGAPVVNRNPAPRADANSLARRAPRRPPRPPAVATRVAPSPTFPSPEVIPLEPQMPLEPREQRSATVAPAFDDSLASLTAPIAITPPDVPPDAPLDVPPEVPFEPTDPFGAPVAAGPDPFGAPTGAAADPFGSPVAAAPPIPAAPPVVAAPPAPPELPAPMPAAVAPTNDSVALSRDAASPALNALLDEAEKAIADNRLDRAASALERAMRIEPRNASLWHDLGQIRLYQKRYDEAELLATKSNTLAGGNSSLQQRNWQMIARVRRAQGDEIGAREAERQSAL